MDSNYLDEAFLSLKFWLLPQTKEIQELGKLMEIEQEDEANLAKLVQVIHLRIQQLHSHMRNPPKQQVLSFVTICIKHRSPLSG